MEAYLLSTVVIIPHFDLITIIFVIIFHKNVMKTFSWPWKYFQKTLSKIIWLNFGQFFAKQITFSCFFGYTVQILFAKYRVTLLQFLNFNFHILMHFCDRFHDRHVSQSFSPIIYGYIEDILIERAPTSSSTYIIFK